MESFTIRIERTFLKEQSSDSQNASQKESLTENRNRTTVHPIENRQECFRKFTDLWKDGSFLVRRLIL